MERLRPCVALLLALLGGAAAAAAEEPPALVKARALYNAADYDGAIEAAAEARREPESADTAALVMARAYLERYRQRADPADLAAGRDAIQSVWAPLLPAREQVDLLVGMGQYLYLTDAFGASAELFDSALAQGYLLSEQERLLLLDWWANALDRSSQSRPAEARAGMFGELVARMEEELRRAAANPVANYWLALGARGAGDLDRAWDAAVAGWVRAGLWPEMAAQVREDLDRLVIQVLVPERVRMRGARDSEADARTMLEEWDRIKEQWNMHPPVTGDP
jgi:hypothetical protein